MNQQIRPAGFSGIPVVTKNLLIINGIAFLAVYVVGATFNFDIRESLGLFFIQSDHFQPFQLITHLFMHADAGHLLMNMFALWMFGSTVEQVFGPKRFLIFYLITGLGAAILHQFVGYLRIIPLLDVLTQTDMDYILQEGRQVLLRGRNFGEEAGAFNALVNVPSYGASGAVFGVLLAFGMLFPNSLIYLFFAIPIKAKWLVIGYGIFELYSGVMNQPSDNIAHFAHLGGMVFGYLLLRYWQKADINKRRWY